MLKAGSIYHVTVIEGVAGLEAKNGVPLRICLRPLSQSLSPVVEILQSKIAQMTALLLLIMMVLAVVARR